MIVDRPLELIFRQNFKNIEPCDCLIIGFRRFRDDLLIPWQANHHVESQTVPSIGETRPI